jgi:hypothetical protein
MLYRERKYPITENDGIYTEDSIEGLERAGFKMVDDPVIMDNGHVLYMLIRGTWWPMRYD